MKEKIIPILICPKCGGLLDLKIEKKSGMHFRVRLGPMDNYKLAKKYKKKLAREFKVKGWVAKY